MPSYKLTYFDIRGRGEIIRMVFEAAGVKFEDIRVSHDDWPTVKQTIPSGKVPVLEIDGKQFPQSHSIARYLARQYGLAGKSDMEQLYADIIADTCEDLLQPMAKFHFEKDEEKKKELFKQFGEKLLPPMIEQMNKATEDWGKSGYLVGNDLTWADLRFYDFMETVLQMFPESLKKNPALVSNREKVAEHPKIKKYLQNRPKTQV